VALPQGFEHGVTDSVEILLFLIWQLLHWLLFGCENSQKRPRATCGNAAGPNRRFHEPGHMGCRAVALPNSVRLIHNRGNLSCADSASRSEGLGGYEVTSAAMLDTVTVKRSIIFI
jgi:hypothetical protein